MRVREELGTIFKLKRLPVTLATAASDGSVQVDSGFDHRVL